MTCTARNYNFWDTVGVNTCPSLSGREVSVWVLASNNLARYLVFKRFFGCYSSGLISSSQHTQSLSFLSQLYHRTHKIIINFLLLPIKETLYSPWCLRNCGCNWLSVPAIDSTRSICKQTLKHNKNVMTALGLLMHWRTVGSFPRKLKLNVRV